MSVSVMVVDKGKVLLSFNAFVLLEYDESRLIMNLLRIVRFLHFWIT
jgi:hypothetical protein